MKKFHIWWILFQPFHIGKLRPFTPTIEKPSAEVAFLSEDPLYLLKTGRYHKVPMILGCCSREGMFVYSLCNSPRNSHLLRDETIVPFNLHLRKGSDKYQMVKNEIMRHYFDGKDPKSNVDDIYRVSLLTIYSISWKWDYISFLWEINLHLQLYTDNYFLFEMFRTAKHHIATSTMPVYFYNFALDTDLNIIKNLYNITDKGEDSEIPHIPHLIFFRKIFFS